MDSKVVKILTSKKFFEIAFVVVIFTSFVFWAKSIILDRAASYQWNVFLLDLTDFEGDFTNVIGYSGSRDPYNCLYYTNLQEKAYPPLIYVFMYLLSRIVPIEEYYAADYFLNMYMDPKLLIMMMIVITAMVIAFFEAIRHNLKDTYGMKVLVSIAMLLTAPVFFSIERGNSIIFVIALMTAFVFGHDSDNKILKELSLVGLAVAAALKISPALLGILLIYKKDWKAVIRTVIYGIVMFVGPFLFLQGGLSNIPLMIRNVQMNNEFYMSKWGLTLYYTLVNYGVPDSMALFKITGLASKVLCLVMLIAAFKFDRKSDVIMVLSLALIIFPDHSGYYNLLYLVPATVMLINEEKKYIYDLIALFAIISFNHLYRFEGLEGGKLDCRTSMVALIIYCIIITCANLYRAKVASGSKDDSEEKKESKLEESEN